MGLAAGQARLLTITARKSDCEYESMRLSHQKIALARDLADLSNEYQNSLNQTKLIYDYYGTGDTSTPLSYGLLMSPSTLNDYLPITITDSLGRVTLNSKYAAAARAAGIPQEGLGSLPSEAMRNAFVQGLYTSGILTKNTAETILGLPYNQQAGFGGGTTTAVTTTSGNIDKLIESLEENGTEFTTSKLVSSQQIQGAKDDMNNCIIRTKVIDSSGTATDTDSADLTLAKLLSDENQYNLDYYGSVRSEQSPVTATAMMQEYLTNPGGFVDWLYDEFSAVLNLGDGYTGKALEYALEETNNLINGPDTEEYQKWHDEWLNATGNSDWDESTEWGNGNVNGFLDPVGTQISSGVENYDPNVVINGKNYVGFVYAASNKGSDDDGNDHCTGGINLNNIAKAFLTYFVKYMDGVSNKGPDGKEKYYVTAGSLEENRLATYDYLFEYTIKTGSEVSSDDLGQATFYDALFNQICSNGWTENDNIEDNEYLQEMLQSGMMYISKMKDDGYYYQANYATDSYIKEISDDTAIAQAEAKYTTEKAKLNAKEETLDLKMKNLDTEISSLSTEYYTVKNTISKNIEKSFKRYNA